jgi:hypothetical protein
MIADAEQWLSVCRGVITNSGKRPFLYPHFPGFNSEHPFQCELVFGDTWRERINPDDLQNALKIPNFFDRIKAVVDLYIKGIEILSSRDPLPQVILCCIPQEVIDYCTVRVDQVGEIKRIKMSRIERLAEKALSRGEQYLFPEMDPNLGIEEEEGSHQNLRRGIKAEAMQYGIPTQLVWSRTLRLSDPDTPAPGAKKSQDIATRAWNFTTALYHKAGGSPWRLAQVEPGVCFIGISFYKEIWETNPKMRTSMAQAFTSAGDGYVLRGNSFEWDESKGRSPHLDQKSSAALMRDVIDLYKRQNRESLPSRIVVHKTSRFWEEELAGFKDACQYIPRKDFVALGRRGIQFYRTGDYPPVRGTYIKFSESDLLFYTVGYIPLLHSYAGARVPQPIEILEHFGDSPWNVVLEEILALTKMNWNTADFACSEPVTIAFSQRVGQILAELPRPDYRPEYRFYM